MSTPVWIVECEGEIIARNISQAVALKIATEYIKSKMLTPSSMQIYLEGHKGETRTETTGDVTQVK